MKPYWKIILPVLAVSVTVAIIFFDRRAPSPELPRNIGKMALVHLVEGEKANEILNRMHDKEVTPAGNAIGMYAGGFANAVVYLSVYDSEQDAQRVYTTMARRIENGNQMFREYRPVRIAGMDASYCVGQGQNHYFFVSRDRLYWLAADTTVAESVAEDFIRELR